MPKPSGSTTKQLLESTTTKSDTVLSEEISKVDSVETSGPPDGFLPKSASMTPNDAHPESEARGGKGTNGDADGGSSAMAGATVVGKGVGESASLVDVSFDGKDGGVDSSLGAGMSPSLGGVAGTTVSSEEAVAESSILKRMEDTFQSTLETQGQLQQLTQLIGALEKAPSEFPQTAPVMEPMSETGPPRDVPPVGDTITHVALIGAGMEDDMDEVVPLEVCQQPSNSAGVDEGQIVVAGEILSGAGAGTREGPAGTTAETRMEHAGTGVGSRIETSVEPAGTSMGAEVEHPVGDETDASKDPSSTFNHTPTGTPTDLSVSSTPNLATPISPQSPTPTTSKSLAPLKGPPKRPRIQLAASFTHQQ